MKIIEKIFSIRANDTNSSIISEKSDNEFYNSFKKFIKSNSKILSQANIVEGKTMQTYYYDLENSSNIINLMEVENLQQPINISSVVSSTPRGLGLQISISRYNLEYNTLSESKQQELLSKIIFSPFLKMIEKRLLQGNYFDKPLFSTNNKIVETADFKGLLKLVRALKEKQDNSIIIGNSKTIDNIVDSISVKSPYLMEYLLKNSIEGVPIISTVEAPEIENGNIIVGVDPAQICLVLAPDFEAKRIGVVGDMSVYFHLFCYANGGDVSNKAISLTAI